MRELLDVALIGVATHKFSRMAAKDKVTSPFRAPFSRFLEKGSPGEIEEESRGTGVQKAIGDLVTCPYCLLGSPPYWASDYCVRLPRLVSFAVSFLRLPFRTSYTKAIPSPIRLAKNNRGRYSWPSLRRSIRTEVRSSGTWQPIQGLHSDGGLIKVMCMYRQLDLFSSMRQWGHHIRGAAIMRIESGKEIEYAKRSKPKKRTRIPGAKNGVQKGRTLSWS